MKKIIVIMILSIMLLPSMLIAAGPHSGRPSRTRVKTVIKEIPVLCEECLKHIPKVSPGDDLQVVSVSVLAQGAIITLTTDIYSLTAVVNRDKKLQKIEIKSKRDIVFKAEDLDGKSSNIDKSTQKVRVEFTEWQEFIEKNIHIYWVAN